MRLGERLPLRKPHPPISPSQSFPSRRQSPNRQSRNSLSNSQQQKHLSSHQRSRLSLNSHPLRPCNRQSRKRLRQWPSSQQRLRKSAHNRLKRLLVVRSTSSSRQSSVCRHPIARQITRSRQWLLNWQTSNKPRASCSRVTEAWQRARLRRLDGQGQTNSTQNACSIAQQRAMVRRSLRVTEPLCRATVVF